MWTVVVRAPHPVPFPPVVSALRRGFGDLFPELLVHHPFDVASEFTLLVTTAFRHATWGFTPLSDGVTAVSASGPVSRNPFALAPLRSRSSSRDPKVWHRRAHAAFY